MNQLSPCAGSIVAEQAIFTSVRSPTGQGYRIIAASPGLRGDEKAEITRRAPSHASLCREGPGAFALMAFPLASGRYCVGLSYDGGPEPTSRGGCRVYTNVAVVDQQTYLRFDCNPVRLHAALRQAVGDSPQLSPETRLPQLTWAIVPTRLDLLYFVPRPQTNILGETVGEAASISPIEAALHISLAMLRNERLLVRDVGDEYELLDKTVITLPMKLRRSLAVSIGLQHSPMRQLQLCFLSGASGDAQRGIRTGSVRWFRGTQITPEPPTGYAAWISLLRRWLQAGRETEVERLTAAITNDASPAALARLAALAADLDELDDAGPSRLIELSSKYERYAPLSEAESGLLSRLRTTAEQRRAPQRVGAGYPRIRLPLL